MKTNFFISGTCIVVLFKLDLPWYLIALFIVLIVCDQALSIIAEIADTKHRKKVMEYYKQSNTFATNKVSVIDAINDNQRRLFDQGVANQKKLDQQGTQLETIYARLVGRERKKP